MLGNERTKVATNTIVATPKLKRLQQIIATHFFATLGNDQLSVVKTNFRNQMGHNATLLCRCTRGRIW